MPRPRKYPTNAARQAAYRKRLKAGVVASAGAPGADAAVVKAALQKARQGA